MARRGNPLTLLLDGLDWSGRSTRLPFVLLTLALTVALGAATVADMQGAARWSRPVEVTGFLLAGLLVVPATGHTLRRLNDLGWSGWVFWLTALPYVGVALWLVMALRPTSQRRRGSDDSILRSLGFALTCLLAVILMSRIFWAPFYVPSGSMKPTLLIGDYFLATNQSSTPPRGAVVVFRHPFTKEIFVKRVIGLPGDTVQMQDGTVILNGTALPQTPDGEFVEMMEQQGPAGVLPRCANGAVGQGAICRKGQAVEMLPDGTSYRVLDIDSAMQDTTAMFTVPPGNLFLMGDNRDNSTDSRFAQAAGGLGFVPIENVSGRARLVLFSAAGRALWQVWTWRSDRFLEGVR